MKNLITISVVVENINEATLERLETLGVGLELSYFSFLWSLEAIDVDCLGLEALPLLKF